MRTVETNIGTMPVQDYREIVAIQNGFDSYEDMRKQGYRLGDGFDFEDDLSDNTNMVEGEKMELEVKMMSKEEMMYIYTQSCQIAGQAGFIGFLRADMDTSGEGFFSSWNDNTNNPQNKTEKFKEEFDEVINTLRFDESYGGMLKNRSALRKFCWAQPEMKMSGDRDDFAVRVNTEKYSYMMRLNPNKGEYNLYCYCYRRDWFDHHLEQAKRGIRFIDPHYNEKFKLRDGGRIRVRGSDGVSFNETCRYIDDYHLEVGRTLYHICELAERMEQNGNIVEPLEGLTPVPERKVQNRGDAR